MILAAENRPSPAECDYITLVESETGRAHKVFLDRNMRALADAVGKLCDVHGITDDCPAVIRVASLQLPTGAITCLISVIGMATDGPVRRVALPPSRQMRASNTFGVRQLYEVERLDGASVDLCGNVTLPDGEFIYAVEFLPTLLHSHLTAREETIMRHVIRSLGEEERCRPYQSLETEASFRREGVEEWLKHTDGLDYAELPELALRPLNVIEHRVAKQFPALKRQTMTLALSKAGILLPPRKRKHAA